MSKKQSIKFEYVPFERLVFLDNNPRTRTPKGLERMAKDIERDPSFYENRPTLVNFTDGEMRVYAGDLRAHAANGVLNWKDIPCNIEADVPADIQARRAILDNTHFENWDSDLLSGWDFEISDLEEMAVPGWVYGADESEGGIPDNSLNSEAQEDDFEVPEVETVKTDIVLGDLFEIGPHRLLCGDSTKAEDVEKLMGGAKADIMVTDPPYGIDLDTDYSKMGSTTTKYEKISGDEKEFDLRDVLAIADVKEKYIWGGDYLVNSLDWMSGTQLIWAKRHSEEENKVFGSAFESLWVSYKCKKAIWFIRPINQSSERLGKHPTQKPVECMSRCISMSKLKGHIYDAFIGSGTTMVAAHQLNRKCYGMELSEKYCQVIVDRMIKLDPTIEVKKNGQPYKHGTN